MVNFISTKSDEGVTERIFELRVLGQRVPAAIWSPENAVGPRPLILMGHGGSQHKRIGSLSKRAKHFAQRLGFATLSIDAPGHGERVTREEALKLAREVSDRVQGVGGTVGPSPEMLKAMAENVKTAVPEWKAALDVVQTLDFVGNHKNVGYWGLSMGSVIGIPLVSVEPRIRCAVFGLIGLHPGTKELQAAAASITVPIEFIFQWDDPIAPRDTGIALYNAFGSKDKAMHIHPGGHLATPAYEGESWQAFFARHLGDHKRQ